VLRLVLLLVGGVPLEKILNLDGLLDFFLFLFNMKLGLWFSVADFFFFFFFYLC
jgi:hypothetical protein